MKKENSGFDLVAHYATDEALLESGSKMMLSEDPSGKAFLLIRMLPDEEYERYCGTEVLARRAELDSKDEKTAAAADREIVIAGMARHIVIGWGGLPYPYSVEKAEEMLTSPHIRRNARAFAVDIGNYRLAAEEDSVKK